MSLNLPLHYILRNPLKESANPLLFILLHGYGSNEEDLYSFAPYLPENAYILSLRAPYTLAYGSYYWYEIFLEGIEKTHNTLQAKESVETISFCISEVKKVFQIPASNCFLCGFSQGAILSFALSLQQPKKLNQIIAMSGYLAPDIVGDIPPEKSLYEKLSYFISHGRMDPIIPISLSELTPSTLEKYDIDFIYKTYPAGHTIDKQNFEDLIEWINLKTT